MNCYFKHENIIFNESVPQKYFVCSNKFSGHKHWFFNNLMFSIIRKLKTTISPVPRIRVSFCLNHKRPGRVLYSKDANFQILSLANFDTNNFLLKVYLTCDTFVLSCICTSSSAQFIVKMIAQKISCISLYSL